MQVSVEMNWCRFESHGDVWRNNIFIHCVIAYFPVSVYIPCSLRGVIGPGSHCSPFTAGPRGQLHQILCSRKGGGAGGAFLLVNIVNHSGLLSALKRGETTADTLITESIYFQSLSRVIHLAAVAWTCCRPPSCAAGDTTLSPTGVRRAQRQ